MAFGIADLVNNISGSIDGLISDLTGKSTNVVSYPKGVGYTDIQSFGGDIKKDNWSKLSFPYTFDVINIKDPGSFKAFNPFSEFQLPLAPQAINQKEEPAISIKPSQGGTTVNHGGLGYKMLNIQGTTGIAPFRGEGGVRTKTGEAIFQPKQLKFMSGYEVFLHLRNWFRSYYQWKKLDSVIAKDYRLIFKNYKDGEFLIVELISFEMDRQAAQSFLYNYKLEFKVLAHFTFEKPKTNTGFLADVDSFIETALDLITTARGVFLRTQGIIRQVEATYNASILEPLRQTTLAIKALLGIPVTAADVGSRTIVNTVSTAKALFITSTEAVRFLTGGDSSTRAEINALLDKRKGTLKNLFDSTTKDIQNSGAAALLGLGAVMTVMDAGLFPQETLDKTTEEQSKSLELPRSFYEDTIASLERVKNNSEDFFNLGSPLYDFVFGRTATLNADFTKTVTNDEYDILNAFNNAILGINLLLSTSDMFKSTFDDRIRDMISRFNGNIDLFANQAVKQMKLPHGITLERLAQQELGDSTRWGEIVELNNLKAPYVSEDPQESRDGVIKAGQNILIPAPLINGFSQVPVGRENRLTKGMSELEKSLGVDLKIDKNFDLVLNTSGDFEMVAGADNMAQATILKLSYEPGDVIEHPSLGAGTIPGVKFPPIEEIKDRLVNTLLQDNRINKITDIALLRENSSLFISFNIFIKQIDIAVPIKIKV